MDRALGPDILSHKILMKLFCQLLSELTTIYFSSSTYLPASVGKSMVNTQANPANIRKHVIALRLPDLEGKEHPDKDGKKVLQYFFNLSAKYQL